MLAVVVLTHWPTMDPLGPQHGAPDKLAHFLAFGVTASLLERSRWLHRGWIAFLIMAIWVPIDEWTQQWTAVSRDATLSDILGGLIGVSTAAVATALLKPTTHACRNWTDAVRTLDALAAPGGGAFRAGSASVLMMAAAFPSIFAILWLGFGWSAATVSAVASLGLGVMVAWPLLQRSWAAASGPPLPRLGIAAWCLIALDTIAGWAAAGLVAMAGVPGLSVPLALSGGIVGLSLVLRRAWLLQSVSHD